MTFITIATIGYGEIVDLSNSPGGRIFTMFISVIGIGTIAYIVTNLTALIVEGELTQSFRRIRMTKKARNSEGHYIICGIGQVGLHIVGELDSTGRHYVVVDNNKDNLENLSKAFPDAVYIEGNASDNSILLQAGIEKAEGIFAVTGDDNENLVIGFTAKQLNGGIRVVARCKEIQNTEKMKKAGAEAVVSPSFIGGLRMASEMVRPTVVSFLDVMLRDKEKNLRIEEVQVPDSFIGRTILSLNLKKHYDILLLAVRTGDGWVYNPSNDYVIPSRSSLIFMTTPKGREELEKALKS